MYILQGKSSGSAILLFCADLDNIDLIQMREHAPSQTFGRSEELQKIYLLQRPRRMQRHVFADSYVHGIYGLSSTMNSEHLCAMPYNVAMLCPEIGSGNVLASETLNPSIPQTLKSVCGRCSENIDSY